MQDERRRRVFNRHISAFVAGAMMLGSGMNINNLGGIQAMAQVKKPVEEENVRYLQGLAVDASAAFRDYLTGSNEKSYNAFIAIFSRQSKGKPLTESRPFMEKLFSEIDAVRADPAVRPLAEAFAKDRGRLAGVFWRNPAVYTDFISAVHNVQAGILQGAAKDDKVVTLAAATLAAKDKAVPKGSDIARVRECMANDPSLSAEDAARKSLEASVLGKLTARYGDALVPQVASLMPSEQARLCIDAFRSFMLTGDPIKSAEFQTIFNSNPGSQFFEEFSKQFSEKILGVKGKTGGDPVLSPVIRAYAVSHPDFNPLEFAATVKRIYNAAINGDVKSVEALRAKSEDRMYVDSLLEIAAKGTARRAADLMLEVMETGSQSASDEFGRLLGGKIATVVDGETQMRTVDQNDIFWREFTRLYGRDILDNKRLSSLFRNFSRNILPIAVRDIYAELSKQSPDTKRLIADYGQGLVDLVAQNAASMGWLLRSDSEIKGELSKRAGLSDPIAISLLTMKSESGSPINAPKALAEMYSRLVAMRVSLQSVDGIGIIGVDPAAVQWLSNARNAQSEIDKRASGKKPDSVAAALKSKYGAKAGEVGSKAYAAISDAAKGRDSMERAYGKDFVDYCWKNLGSLSWLMKPVSAIGTEMVNRPDDVFMRGAQTAREEGNLVAGFSPGTLTRALRDIYNSAGDRARLERNYGKDLVDFVESNRRSLSWVVEKKDYEVENALILQDKGTPMAAKAGEWLFGPRPVCFVSGIASARQAAVKGGLVNADAVDSFGLAFMEPVLSKAAASSRSLSAEAGEQGKRELETQWTKMNRDMIRLEAQLEYQLMEPARPLLNERLRMWRQENNDIRFASQSTSDPKEIDDLRKRQQRLEDSILIPDDLRKSVELAFTMTHLAETGADVSNASIMTSVTTTDTDIGSLSRLRQWYQSLAPAGKASDKQSVIEGVVAGVLSRADPQLYRFISSQNDRSLFDAVSRVYVMAKGVGAVKKTDVQARYGEAFVSLVESHAAELSVLERPGASLNDLSKGQNALFASIVIRCYRALSSPVAGEDRSTMVKLFGERFVAAVESQRSDLDQGDLMLPGAGLAELSRIPQSARQEMFDAYSEAYSMSVGAFKRAFRQQEQEVFHAVASIFAVVREDPPQNASAADKVKFGRRLTELSQAYGAQLVDLVAKNRESLMFMESPSAASDVMRRRLDPSMLEALNMAYEEGPGPGRANFMNNLLNAATRIPVVYGKLSNALSFYNPVQNVNAPGTSAATTATANQPLEAIPMADAGLLLSQALQLYRLEFGNDDYLFNQYFNLKMLDKSLPDMIKHFGIADPNHVAEHGIKTADDLVAFMNSQAGHDLVVAGRNAYALMEQQYLTTRNSSNYHPATGDFTDANVMNLRNQLSILDALYLGMALSSISGTQSAMTPKSSMAVMNSLLVVERRDPYLVGPYLLQVLPAILSVAQDETTLIAAIEAFNLIMGQKMQAGQRDVSYSNAFTRRYFLAVFERISQELPKVVSTFGVSNLEDELRLVAEPRTDEGYMNPMLYRYRPDFMKMEGMEPLPNLYGQNTLPLSLLPRPTMPLSPFLPVPGGFTLDSGARGLFSGMSDFIRPPGARMFMQRVGPKFRIGALGMSTIIKRINECFGPMPTNYQDYWLNAFAEGGAFLSSSNTGEQAGIAATGTERSTTGGWQAAARVLETKPPATSSQSAAGESVSSGSSDTTIDAQARASGLPYPMAGIIPLALRKPEPTSRSESAVSDEIDKRGGDPVVIELTKLEGARTAEALAAVVPELSKTEPDSKALERVYGRDFVDVVARNLDALGWVLYPPEETLGLHQGSMQFHRETQSSSATTTTVGPPAQTTSLTTPTLENTSGILQTYSRIARENKTDMLLYVSGTKVPELTGPTPPGSPSDYLPQITQAESSRMKSRLYFVTEEGNVYQLAHGFDTDSQLMNYLYGGENSRNSLLSMRFSGREMAPTFPLSEAEKRTRIANALGIGTDQVRLLQSTPDGTTQLNQQLAAKGLTDKKLYGSALQGFDGAAAGITIPRSGGDTVSGLAFGQLVKDMGTMDPIAAQHAAGVAVTQMLASRTHRDVYAGFYRGTQTVQMDPTDPTHITNTRFVEATGEVLWRRMHVDPEAYQAEVRAVAGTPTTAGLKAKLEWHPRSQVTKGVGLTAGIANINLLSAYQTVSSDADQMYSNLRNILVTAYGWKEDLARDTGYLVAGTYMQSRLEDYVMRNPDGSYSPVGKLSSSTPGNPQYGVVGPAGAITSASAPPGTVNPNFGSLLMMYWAQKQQILMGVDRVPGFSQMYTLIDTAMRDIQNNPQNQAAILQGLSNALQADLNSDIWHFALGYGYDGERVRVYVVGGGQFAPTPASNSGASSNPQTSYAGLSALFLLGRPTKFYSDILGHAYAYAPLVISQDQGGNFVPATRPQSYNYLDLWTGFGTADWPSWNLMRYQRDAVMSPQPNTAGALLDVYREMGSTNGANWDRLNRVYGEDFVRSVSAARGNLQWMLKPESEVETELKKRKDDEDVPVLQAINFRKIGTAAALLDVYAELRKPNPDMDRLGKQYSTEFVDLVGRHINDFDWLTLEPEKLRAELSARQPKIADARLPAPILHDRLTGEELRILMEQNMVDVLASISNSDSRSGLRPEGYDILLGSHLQGDSETRNDRFYVLMTPLSDRLNAKGSLVIGDDDDLKEWQSKGHEVGRGITRLEIDRNQDKYRFTFSGDRQLRTLNAAKITGGIAIPLSSGAYNQYKASQNWSMGGVASLLQDHRVDLLGGLLYGRREYGGERYDQWTVTVSGRMQTINTSTMSNQLYGYVFFNRFSKQAVFASDNVFSDPAERAAVMQTLGSQAAELTRTTGGAGITWAKVNVSAGDHLNVHAFFEAGTERQDQTVNNSQIQPVSDFVFRGGLGFDYARQERNLFGTKYSLYLTGFKGTWPMMPGDITRPEYLLSYTQGITGAYPGWGLMLYGQLGW